jgi:hypothetical protein
VTAPLSASDCRFRFFDYLDRFDDDSYGYPQSGNRPGQWPAAAAAHGGC